MKNILKKNLLFSTLLAIIIIFFLFSPFSDSITFIRGQNNSNLLQSNVNYPILLESQKTQSIAYVEKYSERNRDFLLTSFNKGKDFFPKISNVLAGFGLPTELKVLIAIESQFKANAVSKAGAVGYWQMMDEVAKDYGLKIGKGKQQTDDRKNLDKSTVAAARLLKDACTEFQSNILLVVASYNCGAGNVRKAIRKSGVDAAGFWDIKPFLPKETQLYVMNFITLNVIFHNFDKFSNRQLVFQPQILPTVPVSSLALITRS